MHSRSSLRERNLHDVVSYRADCMLRRLRGFDERFVALRLVHDHVLGCERPDLQRRQLCLHDWNDELLGQL